MDQYVDGMPVPLRMEFQDEDGVPYDPLTVALTIKRARREGEVGRSPFRMTMTYGEVPSVVRTGTGKFRHVVNAGIGFVSWKWVGSGPDQDDDIRFGTFEVVADPTA